MLSPSSDSARIEALRQGLRDLGYVEGQSIAIESRYAEERLDRLPDLAPEGREADRSDDFANRADEGGQDD